MSAHKLSCLVAVVLALALAPRLSAQEPPEVERTITLLLYGPSGRATDQALRQLLEAARLATKGQLALEAGEGHYLSFQLNSAQLGEPGTTMRLVSAGVPSLSLDARKELLREASALLFIPSEEHKPGQEESALDRRSFDRLRELVSEVADGNGTKPVAIQPRSNVSCALDADTPCFTDRSEGMAAVSWAMTAAVDQEPPPPDVPNAPDLVPMRYPEPPNGLSGAASQRLLAAQRTLQASPFAQQRDDLLPAVWITPTSTSNQRGRSLPVGTSHFGGSPDVPPSFK